jgi:hypothetical protein
MVLKRGDAGEPVKHLQRGLNKLGTMLLVDGDFGRGTREAVVQAREALTRPGSPDEVEDELQSAIDSVPDPFPPLTAAGVTFVARAEVTDATLYARKYQAPCCPPRPSGITIGIGYDCAFVTPSELRADWGGVLSPQMLDGLIAVCGKEGSSTLQEQVKDVVVPLPAAMKVFANRSLALFLKRTRAIYPQVDQLSPARRTALVSLVYNRGARLEDREARQERREMRVIRDLLAQGRFDQVAGQFEAMTRLWDPAKVAGLIQRRRNEAKLWNEGFAALSLE